MAETPLLLFLRVPRWLAVRTDLEATDKLVWATLMDRKGDNSDAYPGIRTIGRNCGIDKSTVQKSIGRLECAGLLTIVRAQKCSKGNPTRYQPITYAKHVRTESADVRAARTRTYARRVLNQIH